MIKKNIMFFLLLSCLLVLTSCTQSPNEIEGIDDSQNSEIVDMNVSDTEDSDWIELSSDELAWFNISFFNNPENQIVNYFLQSEYAEVKDIDIYRLFYDLPRTNPNELTKEEVQSVRAQGNDVQLDIQKVPVKYINEVLQTYANTTLEESNKVKLNMFIYLAEYDAYYMSRGDFHYTEYEMETGFRNNDGLIRLQYGDYEVILKQHENGYYFVSNLRK